jgi:CRISPR-associated protein Cas5d
MKTDSHWNSVTFKVRGRYALFTDPLTRIGGEKCSYHVPTYEALKGVISSVYWKPTFTWFVDKVRVIKPIRTEAKSIKPLNYGGGNTLAIYTYLADVEYQVQAHFEWNLLRQDLEHDRNDNKHHCVAKRMIDKGGRRDVFLGARECQSYVEPCTFGDGAGHYDGGGDLAFGVMFHGFDYPDSHSQPGLHSRFWRPTMRDGVIEFIRPEACSIRKFIRDMKANPPKSSGLAEPGLFE